VLDSAERAVGDATARPATAEVRKAVKRMVKGRLEVWEWAECLVVDEECGM
jgi:hypothetical protein